MPRPIDEPRKRDDWLSRIKSVEKEFHSMRLAANRLLGDVARDPTILTTSNVQPASCRHAADNLEGTYLIRLFAEFESGLRDFWVSIRHTHPQTQVLLASVGSRRQIQDQTRQNADRVRDYRNHLVHELHEPAAPVSIMDARGFLCTYFSRLPPNW